jgi:peptidoglycan-associated lipoprotein
MTRTRISLTIVVWTLAVAGCAKVPSVVSAAAPAPPGSARASRAEGRPAAQARRPVSLAERAPVSSFRTTDVLKDIQFDFDRYAVRDGDAKVLDADAAWLNDNARMLVLIEGHADERGTNEYNLALGDRRAKATRDYLVSRGVRAGRIAMISYGEERPLCTERTEACWARNRRAHFLVRSE